MTVVFRQSIDLLEEGATIKSCLDSLKDQVIDHLKDVLHIKTGISLGLAIEFNEAGGKTQQHFEDRDMLFGAMWKVSRANLDASFSFFTSRVTRFRLEGQWVLLHAKDAIQRKQLLDLTNREIHEWKEVLDQCVVLPSNDASFYSKAYAGKQFTEIDGVKYERELLDLANKYQKSGGRISRDEIFDIFKHALDGNRITVVETRTLRRIMEEFSLTDAAQRSLHSLLSAAERPENEEEHLEEDAKGKKRKRQDDSNSASID